MKSTLKIIITLYLLLHTFFVTKAQVAINTDGTDPDASAILDVNSTNKGMLIPRMTTAEREAISSPATGLLVYDTDENSFWYYESSEWIEITNNQYENITQSPSVVNSLDVASTPYDMEKSGDYLYIVDRGLKELNAYNISNPAAPTLASSVSFSNGWPFSIAINGNYAYVVGADNNGTNEFKVVDISDPNNISLSGEFDIGANLNTIAINGNYAYVADVVNDKLSVVDISTPNSPSLLTDLTFDMYANFDAVILFDGNHLFLNYSNANEDSELSIFDISTPASPSVISTLTVGADGGEQLIQKGNYLYFGDTYGIDIIDISNPAVPSKLSSFSNETQFFTTSGNYLFADYTFDGPTMEVYDISSTTSPSLLYTITKNTNSAAVDMMVIDGYLYSLEANGTLDIYQVAYAAVNALGVDGTVSTHELYDDLGNHSATENIQLDTFWLSNDGDDEGIRIADDGNATLSGTLTIGNTYTLPASDGTVNQVLETDGNGTLSWTDLSLGNFSDTDGDTKIQVEESSDEDIIRFDMNGTEFMRLDSGRIEIVNTGGSIIIGEEAGENDDYSNNKNIFIGYQAGYSNTSYSLNNFIGYQAGYTNTGGGNNNFIGYQAGYSNTYGNTNNFVGNFSGQSNTSGLYNNFVGIQSGENNTNGSYNDFIGTYAGSNNTSGSDNVFLGFSAGNKNSTGNKNTFIGVNAGYSNQTGDENVFIGHHAGYNETGSDKLYIENSSSSSPLIYGEFDNNLIKINGTLSVTQGLADSDKDTKIQVEESSNEDIIRFDIGGTEFLRLDNGRIEVLNTGNSVFIGEDAGKNDDLSDNSNVFVGIQAGYTNTTGEKNSFFGTGAGVLNTNGSYNTAIGFAAGFYNETGSNNVFVGYNAGFNETGSNKLYIENSNSSSPLIYGEFDNNLVKINGTLNINGAFDFPTSDGTTSQVLTTDGSGTVSWSDLDNTLLSDTDADTKIQVEESSDEDIIRFDLGGTEYLRLNEWRIEPQNTGYSVFIGENAGANDDLSDNYNVFIGYEAGKVNQSGNKNVFLGYQAGKANTTGEKNTYLGYQAGLTNSTGSGNIFIGNWAGLGETGSSSNKLYIANSSTSSPLIYGEFDNDLLRINGTLNINSEYSFPTADGSANQVLTTNGSGTLSWSDAIQDLGNHTATQNLELNGNWLSNDGDNEGIQIDDNGSVGIGTAATNGKFEVNGSIDNVINGYTYLSNVNNSTAYVSNNTSNKAVSIYASDRIVGKFVISMSDERIKDIKGISDNQKDLEILQQIQITDYEFKDKIKEGNTKQKKVIAQQVAEVYPQAVNNQFTEIIPDIYQIATIDENGWIYFSTIDNRPSTFELKKGEKVQIIFDDKKELLEVLEITENAFRVNSQLATRNSQPVFVYGRQVNDFHTVDYEAISMLNVSATQELYKLIQKQTAKIEQLEKENMTLKTQMEKFEQLEKIVFELQTKINDVNNTIKNERINE